MIERITLEPAYRHDNYRKVFKNINLREDSFYFGIDFDGYNVKSVFLFEINNVILDRKQFHDLYLIMKMMHERSF